MIRRSGVSGLGGFTLLELIVVVAILAVLSGLIIPLLGGTVDKAQDDSLRVSMANLRDAILGTPGRPGYQTDTRQVPQKVGDLMVNPFPPTNSLYQWEPNVRLGWRGPYIQNPVGTYPSPLPAPTSPTWINPLGADYGAAGDPMVPDPWGRPIVLQMPSAGAGDPGNPGSDKDVRVRARFVRLVSAGLDGVIQSSPALLYPDASQRGDDVVFFLRRPDGPATPAELQ